jgi:hypothetical protein
MREYLIRTADGDEFDIPQAKWAEALRPQSYPSEVIEGWGALRLKIAGCEVSFSPEPPGTQIVFESGDISPGEADAIVREIFEGAESFTGQRGTLIPLQRELRVACDGAAPFGSPSNARHAPDR